MGSGISYGAVTVINAIPCGIGSTIGIDLATRSEFIPGGNVKDVLIRNDPGEDDRMARICVETTLRHIGEDPDGWTLNINSDIPISRGLKSSSSACNSIISSILDEYGFKMNVLEMIRLGVNCARSAGVTVTGAFDDACGCHLGGLVVTNNRRDEIISVRDIGEYDVIISVPERKIKKHSISKDMFTSVRNEIDLAVELVPTDPFRAMNINGALISSVLGVDNSLAELALDNGALAAGMSGTGPAVTVITEKGDGKRLAELLGSSVITRTRGLSYEL